MEMGDLSSQPSEGMRRRSKGYMSVKHLLPPAPQSLDFDTWDSAVNNVYGIEQLKRGASNSFTKWSFVFLIGFVTALVGIFIDFFVLTLSTAKFTTLDENLKSERAGDSGTGYAAFIMVTMNVSMVLVASCCVVFGEPACAGSGIPEIKTILNGVRVPNAVSFRALCFKAVGILFSVAGGLPCGKEGPMIHAGAILGAGIPSGKFTGKKSGRGFDFSFEFFQTYRSDKDKHDYIACGAAAGVSAAFGAPIGGVLFALEEGISNWNTSLTWKTFLSAMVATLTLSLLLTTHGFDSEFNGRSFQG
jgi:H+/Cl- antiporter ClcA